MMRLILKMGWSKRKTYLGIYVEQVLAFIVLSFCFVTIAELLSQPRASGVLNTSNVITVVVPFNPAYPEAEQRANELIARIKQSPDVISLAKSIHFIPYVNYKEKNDSICVDNKMLGIKVKYTDENAFKVFEPEMIEGSWLKDDAMSDGSYPVVITRQFADQLGWRTSVGKQVSFMQFRLTIVGVMEEFEENALANASPSVVLPFNIAMSAAPEIKTIYYAIKLQNGKVDSFFSFYIKEFSKVYPEINTQSNDLQYIDMDTMKNADMYGINVSITAMILICFFIILYTFIGSYGLISLNSEKRAGEFALQMALGLTKRSLRCHVILENVLVTLFSTIPGIIVILYLYSGAIDASILIALVVSIVVMILFSLFSAWYPAFKVSRMDPAEVLKKDL